MLTSCPSRIGVGTQRSFLRRSADPSFLGESSHVPRTTPTNVPPVAVYVEEERRKKKITAGRKGVHILYYGLAESVIIAGPRNAHRRPLIPPLAILFSSLLARSPCRPRGTFPPAPCVRPIAPPPPLPKPPACAFLPLCRRVTTRARPLCNHYRLSQPDARVPRISFSLFFPLSSLRVDKL